HKHSVFALLIASPTLNFKRDGSSSTAHHHVEVSFRTDTSYVRQFATDETVRVRTLQETQRADESVIYQEFLSVPPGIYHVSVTVRDRNGPAATRRERVDTVP